MNYSIWAIIFLFGLVIGSFLNCLIWRLHRGEKITGRSYCPNCKQQIAWHDNLPLLSFIVLRGRCRRCQEKISWQYPLVELMTALLFVYALTINLNKFGLAQFQNFQFPISNFQTIFNLLIFNVLLLITILRDWLIISVMIVIFIYDLRWYIIPDIISLPAAAIVLILNLILGHSWQNLLISGIIGGSFFLFQFIISRGRWIGGGDIRLGLLIGLALGWPLVLVAIILAYFIGSLVSVGLVLSGKKQWGSQVPLGVFLTSAAIITLFWGEIILSWYVDKVGGL